jgi:anti-anti-sigma factor
MSSEQLTEKQGQILLGELQSYSIGDRPQIVLDCSKLSRMERPALQLLLCCLEEAIKRNGDVKLVAVPAAAQATLKLTGADRLFEIFDTSAEAVSSFHRISVETVPHGNAPGGPRWAAGNVA